MIQWFNGSMALWRRGVGALRYEAIIITGVLEIRNLMIFLSYYRVHVALEQSELGFYATISGALRSFDYYS
jgi:hypothetical protein